MADYRRFISYMYLYENGRKTVNSGFVRVESRNGQCRVHIHMIGVYGTDNENYGVFMFIRETGGYIGIDAGSLRIRQQVGELDLSTDSSHLMGTDYGLDRVSGIVVLGGDGRIYGTRWDDEQLETESFVSREQLSDRLVLFSVNKERRQKPLPGKMAEGTLDNPELKDVSETAHIARSDEAVDQESTPSDRENNAEYDSALEEEPVMEELESNAVEEETESEQETEMQQQNRQERPNAYEVLLQQFPQMYPFDDNSIEFCVRLDLKDIGMLPMQCWLYGSNSFLLHGYYCYRHLILAKIRINREEEDKEEIGYILGVPGIWQHREQYMASMFGFGNFKPVSRENTGSGAFGYWFTGLK